MVRSADEQLANLSADAARRIEEWLRDNPEWFTVRPDQVRVPYDLNTNVPDLSIDPSEEELPSNVTP